MLDILRSSCLLSKATDWRVLDDDLLMLGEGVYSGDEFSDNTWAALNQ